MARRPLLADAALMLEARLLDLAQIRVADCMHHGIVSCDPSAPLAEVAATMCSHRVHAVAVAGEGGRSGIVSDSDLIAAAERAQDCTAADIAATEWLTISAGRSLHEAARMMTEHAVSHLFVRDAGSGHLTGVISTTDIMCAIAAAAQT